LLIYSSSSSSSSSSSLSSSDDFDLAAGFFPTGFLGDLLLGAAFDGPFPPLAGELLLAPPPLFLYSARRTSYFCFSTAAFCS
jgi:hypothetical protein